MALDELLDEHEQGERVRNWLRQNSFGLIGGLALGLALIGGGRWWMQEAHEKRLALGESYAAVVADLQAGDAAQAKERTAALAGTAYAPLAALDLAKVQVDAGAKDDAIATLRGAGAEEPALTDVIEHRLARLLIDADKPGEALTLLADAQDASALETRGDARYAMGEIDQAREDYEQALRKLDPAAPQRRLLELKLTQTGGSPVTTGIQS